MGDFDHESGPGGGPANGQGRVDELLRTLEAGGVHAQEELFQTVYADLHRMAQRQLRDMPRGATLQPTALVNEVYIRLFGRVPIGWAGDRHFFFAAARAMRDIVVEYARRKASRKRGGGWTRVGLDTIDPAVDAAESLLEVDAAVERLQRLDAVCADIVRLHYFAGLTQEQVAQVLDLNITKVRREWKFAKAWLSYTIERKSPDDPPSRLRRRDA